MALSDAAIRHAKPTGKDYTLGDIDGLSLAVGSSGGRSWHFRFAWHGKQKRMSLGTYPELTLREARALRDEARTLLAQGINPLVQRRNKREADRLAEENTFKSTYDQWLAHRALTTAEKCRTWLNQLFRFAMVKLPALDRNPATDLDVVAMPKPPVNHQPFLRMYEIPALLNTLNGYGGLQTRLGIRLLLLTGVRTGELRWATPSQFDLTRGLWVIPSEVVK